MIYDDLWRVMLGNWATLIACECNTFHANFDAAICIENAQRQCTIIPVPSFNTVVFFQLTQSTTKV